MKAAQACYWIIGAHNMRQAPAVAIDLHAPNGERIGETYTAALPIKGYRPAATRAAELYARAHGVTLEALHYDHDSTAAFATC